MNSCERGLWNEEDNNVYEQVRTVMVNEWITMKVNLLYYM